MSIVNTLDKCLDSPYLFVDEDAPKRVGALLSKAGDRLEAAANILTTGQGDGADATFLSYEAMFSTIRALVYHHGYREAGLRCLLLACESLYVRKGLVDVQHLQDFQRVQALRVPPDEALIAASKFVKRALELMTQPQGN